MLIMILINKKIVEQGESRMAVKVKKEGEEITCRSSYAYPGWCCAVLHSRCLPVFFPGKVFALPVTGTTLSLMLFEHQLLLLTLAGYFEIQVLFSVPWKLSAL